MVCRKGCTSGQYDAYSVVQWVRIADLGGILSGFFAPILLLAYRARGQVIGWIPCVSQKRAIGNIPQ